MAFLASRATRLALLIDGGDLCAADRHYTEWCITYAWTPAESRDLRAACARWHLDAARFGVRPRPACPSWLWSLRATLTLEPVPAAPTFADLTHADTEATAHPDAPEYAWRAEAIRWRMAHPEGEIDMAAVQAAVSSVVGVGVAA